ncbi:histone deacetylase 9-B [Chanos chanos]|uniref:histone deacetylase n=1 Tax=Chanos chanos TaxID=29144 RepID=A0A6J2WGV9_CHACN|nr:histone deacetylase 9-B-like [Chanos chanos]
MLQTIYESESRIPAEWLRKILDKHSIHSSVIGLGSEVLSAVDSSEKSSMPEWERDSEEWERQLQRELLLIQRQQQIQKQLLISEFQKQHQNLLRQHQAQLQEHIKLQQALLTLRQQQEVLAEERRLVAEEERKEEREEEQECHRREQHQHALVHRKKERTKESAMASTEVRQKLHDFLLSKSAKDTSPNGTGHAIGHRPKLWYMATEHMSVEQSSPPLGETPPTFKYPLPTSLDGRDDFPLRKTASEPNLKVRSRLKQKVSERRSGPMQRRRDGSVLVTPQKKRTLELTDSSANDSSPGSGPSSPIGLCNTEHGASYRPSAIQIECLSQKGLLKAEGSMALLNLYTSPSLPNLTLGLHSTTSPLTVTTALKERTGEVLPGQTLGAMPPVALETKVNSSHQALLQHLLLKEQSRQQKILSPSSVPVLTQSPLAMKERVASSVRSRLPRHRPLNRTQSAPLPQSTLAQLVLQQQHHNFVEKQKQYQHQVHMNQILTQSIEQLRNPSAHLQEEDEESALREQRELEDTLPPGGVIRSHSLRSSSNSSGSCDMSTKAEATMTQVGVIKVKEEPLESESEMEEAGEAPGISRRDFENVARQEVEQNAALLQVKVEDCIETMTETNV